MSVSLDLNLLAVSRSGGTDSPELIGLHVSEPPRRCARGRKEDRLILYLSMQGNAPLPPARQEQALSDLAKLYFNTPGAVTSALRVVAGEFNRLLLTRNLRIASSGRQGVGWLMQVVVRGQQLFIAQSGPGHSYLITAMEAKHFNDPEMADKGLGQGRTTPLTFFQGILQANDVLLLATQPSPDWDEKKLSGMHGQGPESLRRRLFSQIDDVNAVLIQAKAGHGKFFVRRLVTAPPSAKPSELGGQERAAIPTPLEQEATLPEPAVPVSLPSEEEVVLPQETVVKPRVISTPKVHTQPFLWPVWKPFITLGTPLAKIFLRILAWWRNSLARILPSGEALSLPTSTMAFIAIVIPILVVTAASVTYLRLGRAAQYQLLFEQAKAKAQQASSQADLMAQRADWEATLQLLQQAEQLQVTSETQELRMRARNALDELDLIKQLDFQPAIVGGLPLTVKITHMAFADNDLFLLDANQGKVLRAVGTSRGYELDYSFICGLGLPGGMPLGSLIDIEVWPVGYKPEAALLALSANGNAVFCSPKSDPLVYQLASPPTQFWGNFRAFTLDVIDFYLLDPASNAVWIYWDSKFEEQPRLYFDETIPYMQDVIDLAVNRDELYLLHADGHLTLCDFGTVGLAPTRCYEPGYLDFRPGRENIPFYPPNPFSQVLLSQPPDPSLYLLEPRSHAVYHFSLRSLTFQREFLPQKVLSNNQATAFALNTVKRLLFLAIGNEVYYAAMP